MTVVDEGKQHVHEALGELVDEGEMVVGWHVTLEAPQVWTVVGWLEAASMSAKDQLRGCTIDFDVCGCDEEEEDE